MFGPVASFSVEYQDLPDSVTLHLVYGTFEMVLLDPNTNKRMIAWRSSNRIIRDIIADDEEIETMLALESFAGQPCVVAVLLEPKSPPAPNKTLIGIKNLDTNATLNEQRPEALRVLSRYPVLNMPGFPLTNLFNWLLAGIKFPEKTAFNLGVAWLVFLFILAPAFFLVVTPMYFFFADLVHNGFFGLILFVAVILGILTVLFPKVMNFKNHVYSEQEARSFVRLLMRHLEGSGQFQALQAQQITPTQTAQDAPNALLEGRL